MGDDYDDLGGGVFRHRVGEYGESVHFDVASTTCPWFETEREARRHVAECRECERIVSKRGVER